MEKIEILWVDDEVDLLKPHVLFLEQKGYSVDTINNGDEALDMLEDKRYDIIFLDENMPGLSGLETLGQIKERQYSTPVVMITKSEEEHIMEDAIGSRISDYLIKPVNPNQILLSIKKNLDTKRLVSEKTTMNYQQEFRQIGMSLSDMRSFEDWAEMYRKLVYWELELERLEDEGMNEVLQMQKTEANGLFSRFIEKNYIDWLHNGDEAPVLSHTLFKKQVSPLLDSNKPLFLIVIDNFRLDQWKTIQPIVEEYFTIKEENTFYSILPTATHYARNALFAGLMPSEIERRFPELWKNENDEGGKNLHEAEFLADQLRRLGKNIKYTYHKITQLAAGKKLVDNISNLMANQLNVIVYNFVDMLSHAKTEMEVIRELADNDKAYRSLTLTWFKNSPLLEIIKQIADKGGRLVITTDHGTINVTEPSKIVGDRNTNTNLRYKQGKSLSYDRKEVFEVRNPQDIYLPRTNVSTAYVFARETHFFAYPNNYNYYVNYYKNTYQHGGISMEEVIVPYVFLSGK